MLLKKLNLPNDLKTLNREELVQLCAELRTTVLDQVSKTGGHLASNLGIVELTVMLHRVFDTPTDKIVWDVGHQTYVHKLLTGRLASFSSLRQKGGISGFPKAEESEYDSFNTGHSSTSISVCAGMAAARDLNGDNYHIIGVIGDGSLTGGLAFEALNHVGHEKRNMLIILNDNEMSIRKNVGAISSYLNRFRSKGIYYRLKQITVKTISSIPKIGRPLYRFLERTKDSMKRFFSIGTLFEALGFHYVGPIDGHDLGTLEQTLIRCKAMKGPILLHIKTVKGKGFTPAEKTPDCFHGVGPFDLSSENAVKKKVAGYAKAAGETLLNLAKENDDLVVVSAAMLDGTGLDVFAKTYPDRTFDVGIAEAHATTFSAGLAKGGKTPVFVVYSSFFQRAYDQIIHDVCMQNLHVVFMVDHAGMVGADGETHQGLFDVTFLKTIPNLTVFSASSPKELGKLLSFAVNKCTGPVAIRYEKEHFSDDESYDEFTPSVWHKTGADAVILTYGRLVGEAAKACELLEEKGISCGLLKLVSLKPLDREAIVNAAACGRIFVFEECMELGGAGETVSALVNEAGSDSSVFCYGVPDQFVPHATVKEQLNAYGLDADGMVNRIVEALKR